MKKISKFFIKMLIALIFLGVVIFVLFSFVINPLFDKLDKITNIGF